MLGSLKQKIVLVASVILLSFLAWGGYKVNDYLIAKRDLESKISSMSGELRDALKDAANVRSQLTVVSAGTFDISDTVPSASPEIIELLNTGPNNSTLCADWTDKHGRFIFHQSSRSLDINQKFKFTTTTIQKGDGSVDFTGELTELSPLDGSVLGVLPVIHDYQSYIPPPTFRLWEFSIGLLADPDSAGLFARAVRYFPYRTFASAELNGVDGLRIYGGFSFFIHARKQSKINASIQNQHSLSQLVNQGSEFIYP